MNTLFVLTAMLMASPLSDGQATDAGSQRADDEARLSRIKVDSWPRFYREQDADGLADFLADTFLIIGPDGATSSRAEEVAAVRASRWEATGFRYTIDRIAWLDPDMVLIVGRGASDRTGDDGRPCRHNYVSSNLLRRAPDSRLGWRALTSHVSGVTCMPA